MKSILISLGILCLHFILCYSQVCIPTWTPYNRSFSNGGTSESSASQLQDCLARCERKSYCLAADFYLSVDIHCWLHYNLSDLIGDSFKENGRDYVTQYRINRNCTDYGKGPTCSPQWTQNTSVGSYRGEQVNYWTEFDCFTYCRYSNACEAIDYNNKTSPPCWIHKDFNPNNISIASDSVVNYRLNKTCSPVDNSTRFSIGRCVGQNFSGTSWCPPRTNIHVTDSWFKVNPLCCYRNAEDAYPPDSSSIPRYQVQYLDPTYFSEINSSCDGMSNCSIQAKSNSAIVDDLICPDGEIGTNYVSVVYQCISDGSTPSEEISTNTIRETTVTAIATAKSTVKTPPSDVEKAASNDVTTNKNALIIGLVIGLGVPLILIIIIVIVIVVLVRRRKRKWKSEPKEVSVVDNYFYNAETMPRGVVPENEQNEISMAVDSLY